MTKSSSKFSFLIMRMILAVVLSFAFSCQKEKKSAEDSEVQSLDRVLFLDHNNPRLCGVGAAVGANKAIFEKKANGYLVDGSGKPTDKFIVNESGNPQLSKFVAQTLVAVPATVLIQIFNPNDQGQIVLSEEKVNAECSAVNGVQPYGCIRKKSMKRLQVYIRPQAAIIGMKLLEMLAYHMSANLDRVQDSNFALTAKNEELANAEQAFKTQIQLVKQLRDQLKVAFDTDVANNNAETAKAYRRMTPDQQKHFVFSQTVDSVYCSSMSFQKLATMAKTGVLKNTNDAFFASQNQGSLYSIIGLPWHFQTTSPENETSETEE